MNLETVTIEDCVDNYYRRGRVAILNDGELLGFKEEIPTQTANPSGDNQ